MKIDTNHTSVKRVVLALVANSTYECTLIGTPEKGHTNVIYVNKPSYREPTSKYT